MQRNHMGVVRELQAIHGNVESLHEAGDALLTDQPGIETGVRDKLKDLDEQWSEVGDFVLIFDLRFNCNGWGVWDKLGVHFLVLSFSIFWNIVALSFRS